MTGAGTRVTPEWLALRETADAAARSPELVDHLRRRISGTRALVVHDLAGGTGGMGRWLAPLLPGPQRWVVRDWEANLLSVAAADPPPAAADGAPVAVHALESDITQLEPGDLADADLITASALLDLMTGDQLRQLIDVCSTAGCPMLITLSVTGGVSLTPPDPLDARVAAAFNDHQRRTTAGGRLLGPDAVRTAKGLLSRTEAEVLVRPSPWRLGPAESALAQAWFGGWIGAACEQDADMAAGAAGYTARRLSQARAGLLDVTVEHADLLVLPREP